jgi:hypothetical protein
LPWPKCRGWWPPLSTQNRTPVASPQQQRLCLTSRLHCQRKQGSSTGETDSCPHMTTFRQTRRKRSVENVAFRAAACISHRAFSMAAATVRMANRRHCRWRRSTVSVTWPYLCVLTVYRVHREAEPNTFATLWRPTVLSTNSLVSVSQCSSQWLTLVSGAPPSLY